MALRLGCHMILGMWLAGCGARAAKPEPPPPAPVPVVKVRMAILPAESDTFPRVADAINQATEGVKVAGVDETFKTKTPLEVMQISIECTEETPECLKAVGNELSADRMLFARIVAGKKVRKKKPVKISVTLFDVSGASEVARSEAEFDSDDAAAAGARDLVDRVVKP